MEQTDFQTLVLNAVDRNSRNVAHRAARQGTQLVAYGENDLPLAKVELANMITKFEERRAQADNDATTAATLRSKLRSMRVDADLHGTKNGVEQLELSTKLDELEAKVKEWSELEPAYSARIAETKTAVAELERKQLQADYDQRQDFNRKMIVKLIDSATELTRAYRALHGSIEATKQLQHELGLPPATLDCMPSLKLTSEAGHDGRLELLLDNFRRALLA